MHYISCVKFRFCLSTVSNVIIILLSGSVGYNIIGVDECSVSDKHARRNMKFKHRITDGFETRVFRNRTCINLEIIKEQKQN